jgi:hypothetical protein
VRTFLGIVIFMGLGVYLSIHALQLAKLNSEPWCWYFGACSLISVLISMYFVSTIDDAYAAAQPKSKPMRLQYVIKNPKIWIASDFDRWGSGEGVGLIVNRHDDWVNVRWPTGRSGHNRNELLTIREAFDLYLNELTENYKAAGSADEMESARLAYRHKVRPLINYLIEMHHV